MGKYNVFEDPIVRELGLVDQVKQVLKGKTVFLTDFYAPYQDMIRYFNVVDRDIQTISHSSRLFRQKVGVTPSTYRENAKVK